VWWALHRRGGGSLSARLSSLASGGMKSRPPVWVKCLVANNGLLEDRPGGQPSRYLRSAARRTAMVTDQVLAARYRSCSVRPPACQASQRPAESPQSDDACSPAPPRCSHADNGTEHAMPIRFPASAAPAPSSANPVPLKEERWNRPPPARRPSATMSRPCTPGACPLERLGVPGPLAEICADCIDWHQIAQLVRRGCPPGLALRNVS
jgi:hypothetical protein